MNIVYFISEIVKVYPYSELSSANFDYFIRLYYNADDAGMVITTKVSLPGYVINYAKFKVSYLQIVISQTALTKDYPLYKFTLSTFSTTTSSSLSAALPYDAALKDVNVMYGIT